ncbi:MAG TPA: protein kinase, partial [Thermoanaerobaculia bacterium]|nr:protein kinase [Thermoanaerobaculia bacterium]
SPKYMSPEQIQGEPLDARSDLYSVGVILFGMLTGKEPFTGKTPSIIALKQLKDSPPDVGELRPDLPSPWQRLLGRLLRKRREERFASADDVLAALGDMPLE